MTSIHVLNLPCELLSNIISDWLDVRSVARFDSSLCCRARRLSILSTCILSSTQDPLKRKDRCLSSLPAHKWLVERKIRAKKLAIGFLKLHGGENLGDEHLPVYTELFKLSANTLRDLCLFHLEDNVMQCVLSGCTQLRSLYIDDCFCELADTLLHIIRESPHLTYLRIAHSYPQYIPWSDEVLQANLCNNHITKLSITGNVLFNETLIEMTRLMPHLTSLQLEGVASEDDGEIVYDSTYVEVCKNCPNLKHISFHNFIMTDTTFTEIVTTLRDLQSVHVHSLSEMTDESIESLMQHHAHSLQNLCLEECDDITLNVTKQLLCACTNLRILHLVDYHRADVTDLLRCTAFANLIEVHISSDSDSCSRDLQGVLRQCKSLQVLGLTITRVNMLPSVVEDLVDICARFQSLRKIVLYGTDSMEKKLRKLKCRLPLSKMLEVQRYPTFDVLSF